MDRPTLIIGLGGKGIDVVCNIAERVEREHRKNVQLLVLDTDANWLKTAFRHPNVRFIQTSPRGTVGEALNRNDAAREEWFPVNEGLNGKVFSEGAGQVRAISRLAFDFTVANGNMSELEDAIAELRGLNGGPLQQELRIVITGSIAGGTGSGLILPLALYLRNYLITRYQDYSALIRGYFLEPDTLFGVISDEDERNSLRANAYATIRELDAFFKKESSRESAEFSHVVFNAPQPGLGERMDYPNLLPYNFVFLMDAINEEGEHLTTESYTDHVSDVIYAQALGQVSDSSNSSEDNVIRNLAASKGRARYGGAGCSYLEYPVADVQRYIGLSWARDSISGEWLELDREFELKRRTEGLSNDERGEEYVKSFKKKLAAKRPFYTKAHEGVARVEEVEGSDPDQPRQLKEVDRTEDFVNSVISHATAWAAPEGGVSDESKEFSAFWAANGETLTSDVAKTEAAFINIYKRCNGQVESFKAACASSFEDYEKAEKDFLLAINDDACQAAKSAARSTYTVSEYDGDPVRSRSDAWLLEPYLRSPISGKFIHPSGVRYLLYDIADKLREKLQDYTSERDKWQSRLNTWLGPEYDYDESTDKTKEDIQAAVQNVQGARSIRDAIHNTVSRRDAPGSLPVTDESEQLLVRIGERLSDNIKALNALLASTCVVEFLTQALNYVDELSRAYEAFYRTLGGSLTRIGDDIKAIESDFRYNTTLGMTHRYVCASKECLQRMRDICVPRTDAGELPSELCENVYLSLLTRVQRQRTDRALGRAGRNDARDKVREEYFYRSLMQSAVLDFWCDRVMSEQDGYPSVVDKSVLKAIADEVEYLQLGADDDSDETHDQLVGRHFEDVIKEAHNIAIPFIEHSSSSSERRIQKCTYSEATLDDCGMHRALVKGMLTSMGAIHEDPDDPANPHVIMFYRAVYGLRSTDLPKFAPESNTETHIGQEGEYHRAYWSLVQQLGPDLAENSRITPHLDRNWHLVAYLPDLSESYERALKAKVVKAFVFGLLTGQFSGELASEGSREYYLKAPRGGRRTRLITSNGTPCDKFYEVFDALKINPPVVDDLLGRCEESIQAEQSSMVAPTASRSSLVTRCLKSSAFRAGYSLTDDLDRVVGDIAALSEGAADGKGSIPEEYVALGIRRLLDDCVRKMFEGTGTMSGKAGATYRDLVNNVINLRRSILEIPLVYSISLPSDEERYDELEEMIDGVFSTVRGYLEEFSKRSLHDDFGHLLVEQYLRFEANLLAYERMMPNVHGASVVNAIRDKVSTLYPVGSTYYYQINRVKDGVTSAWEQHDQDMDSGSFDGGMVGGPFMMM